jgi:hypothetical protein
VLLDIGTNFTKATKNYSYTARLLAAFFFDFQTGISAVKRRECGFVLSLIP